MDDYNFSLLSLNKKAWKICGVIESLLASLTGIRILSQEKFSFELEKLKRYLTIFSDSESLLSLNDFFKVDLQERIRKLRKISYAVLDRAKVPFPETDFIKLKKDPFCFEKREFEHEVLLDDIRSPFNIGSIIRTAEAFGFKRVILYGISAKVNEKKIKRASMSADLWIEIMRINSQNEIFDFFKKKKEENFIITALEKTEKSTDLENMKPASKRILIVGNEEFGINPEFLSIADEIKHIRLSGIKNSLNAAVAFGIICHETVLKTIQN